MRDKGIRLLKSFLCGGTSALLISVAHLHSQFWFVSLFALIPFLWRVIGRESCAPDQKQITFVRTTRVLTCAMSKLQGFRPTTDVVLGMMLATCYALVAYPTELWTTPGAFLLKLFALNLIFTAYGLVVNRLKRHLGFNAVFIAALWLPLEYALSHYVGLGSLLALSNADSALVYRIGSLFGVLVISFTVVLINSLILIFLKRVVRALLSIGTHLIKEDRRPYPPFKETILERRWYCFPHVRAPPIIILNDAQCGCRTVCCGKRRIVVNTVEFSSLIQASHSRVW